MILSHATEANVKASATSQNSLMVEGTLIVAVEVGNIEGLAADMAHHSSHAVAQFYAEGGNSVFTATSTEDAMGLLTEMEYHIIEAMYC